MPAPSGAARTFRPICRRERAPGLGRRFDFSLLQAMLGFQPDAPNQILYVDPALPEWMPDLTVRDFRFASLTFDIRFAQKGK